VRRSSLLLAGWTLLVWLARLRNAADEGVGSTVLAATFVVGAVAVLVRRRERTTALVLAGFTVAVWLVRGADIALLSDHGTAFVVVHLVLATVSIALASWVVADVTGRRAAPPAVG
jgi:uncharacterized PurR-regulated membrane protein YhhQ (DUF165 family)